MGQPGAMALAVVLALFSGIAAAAQATHAGGNVYPARSIRVLVPFPAGGGSDITARIVSEKLSDLLGQQVIVDNRAGAGGNIAGQLAARAAPDGHTLYLITASTAVAVALYERLGYDLARDFAPVVYISELPYTFVVSASFPAASFRELLTHARAKPNSVSYGSNGLGGLSHVSGELLGLMSKSQMLHVPFKGGAQALSSVMSGEITALFATPLLSAPHARSGKLRILAVTSPQRSKVLPEVPTISESGVPGYAVMSWNGVLVPKATPSEVVATLHARFVAALQQVEERLAKDGSTVVGGTPEQFGTLVESEVAKWARLARQIGLKPQ